VVCDLYLPPEAGLSSNDRSFCDGLLVVFLLNNANPLMIGFLVCEDGRRGKSGRLRGEVLGVVQQELLQIWQMAGLSADDMCDTYKDVLGEGV